MRRVMPAALLIAALVTPAASTVADAVELRVVSGNGARAAIQELVSQFERASGHKVALHFEVNAALRRKIEAGEAFDVAVLNPPVLDALIKQGKIVADTRADVGRAGLGVAVRAGAPKPDISTVEAFKRTMLNAKSLMYTDPKAGGASGVHFAKVIERLGIADQVNAKAKLNSGGFNAEFVARGEIELGIQQVSEIVPVKGAELAGLFPEELQNVTTFAAAVCTNAPEPDAAAGLLRFLKSPAAVRVIEANGMEPC
jgi:molybdate transport system substrate-binding protein